MRWNSFIRIQNMLTSTDNAVIILLSIILYIIFLTRTHVSNIQIWIRYTFTLSAGRSYYPTDKHGSHLWPLIRVVKHQPHLFLRPFLTVKHTTICKYDIQVLVLACTQFIEYLEWNSVLLKYKGWTKVYRLYELQRINCTILVYALFCVFEPASTILDLSNTSWYWISVVLLTCWHCARSVFSSRVAPWKNVGR